MNNDTENSDLKRRIKALETENKRLKKYNECDKIIQNINKVHQALKPLYVRLDELVLNPGLEHIALNIFQHLDLPTLSRCRQVSSNWKKCIDNDKYWWKKVLKHQVGDVPYKVYLDPHGQPIHDSDLVEVLNYICAQDNLTNMKLLGQLILDFYVFLNDQRLPCSESASLDTPIHYAAFKNRMDIFDFLAKIPVMPNLNIPNVFQYDNQKHETLLGNACVENQTLVLEYFMNLKGDKKIDFNCKANGLEGDLTIGDDEGFTLFHEACNSENIEVVKLFLKYAEELNIALNQRDSWEETPFLSETTSKDVLGLLLNDERIDVNATNVEGNTKLSKAFDFNDFSEEENLEVIDCLLSSSRIDVKISRVGHLQRTLLHTACQNKFHRGVEKLLKVAKNRGIDVNQKDSKGLTAAHHAFGYNMGFTGQLLEVTSPFTLTKFSPTIEVILKYTKELDILYG